MRKVDFAFLCTFKITKKEKVVTYLQKRSIDVNLIFKAISSKGDFPRERKKPGEISLQACPACT
jgi:hypothetical protein